MRRLAAIVSFVLLLAPAASAGPPFHYKEFAQGANVFFTDCPLDSLPASDRVCHDYSVWYVRFTAAADDVPLGPLDRSGTPFVAQYTDLTYLVHPDGSADDLRFQVGSTTDVTGTYDKTHLATTHMNGATIEMSDIDLDTGAQTPNGRTVVLGPFTWTANTGIFTFGNDGPVLGDSPRHVANRCETLNQNFHQRFALGTVTGTVDGVSIDAYVPYPQVSDLSDDAGAIFNNWFHVSDLTRGCV